MPNIPQHAHHLPWSLDREPGVDLIELAHQHEFVSSQTSGFEVGT